MKLSATVKYYNDVTEETCKKKKKSYRAWQAIDLCSAVGNCEALGKIFEQGCSLMTVVMTVLTGRNAQEDLEQDGDIKAERRVSRL